MWANTMPISKYVSNFLNQHGPFSRKINSNKILGVGMMIWILKGAFLNCKTVWKEEIFSSSFENYNVTLMAIRILSFWSKF
jgi:hypothetical protein